MKFQDMMNTITLGDSYELIKDIPSNSIDLVIIDPPYLFDNFGGGCFGSARKSSRKELESIRHGFDYLIIDEFMLALSIAHKEGFNDYLYHISYLIPSIEQELLNTDFVISDHT